MSSMKYQRLKPKDEKKKSKNKKKPELSKKSIAEPSGAKQRKRTKAQQKLESPENSIAEPLEARRSGKKEMTFVEPDFTSGTVDDFGTSLHSGASAAIAAAPTPPSSHFGSLFSSNVIEKLNLDFEKLFLFQTHRDDEVVQIPTLLDAENRSGIADSGLLGACAHVQLGRHPETDTITSVRMAKIDNSSIYLNVHSPFCAVITGVQGSGKSHTMAVILENCLLPCNLPPGSPLTKLQQPLSALVLHYDRVDTNICEATGLAHPSLLMEEWIARAGGVAVGLPPPPAIEKIVVLVSPTFYTQRRAFYANDKRYDVRPLLFRWSSLDAVTLKKLMRIDESGSQLYLSTMLSDLRQFQRDGRLPAFSDFMERMCDREDLTPSQKVPLRQRLEVLKHFVAESSSNQSLINKQVDLPDLMGAGSLVVADMTDPMLSPSEANGVFQVLLGLYRKKKVQCGKVVVCDEAHKYFDSKNKRADGLANSIVETARLMRHEGIRLVISTQSPLTMPPELLELATMQISHGFHSKDWYDYLSKKVPLPKNGFEVVRRLKTGQALVFSRTPAVPSHFFNLGQDTLLMQVRQRMTQDRGQTLTHQSANLANSTQQLTSQEKMARHPGSTRGGMPVRVASRAPQPSSSKSAPSANNASVEAICDADQQVRDFIIMEVSRAGDTSMLYSILGTAFHHQFRALPQRKQVFKRTVDSLIKEGTLAREGRGGLITIRLLPCTQHTAVTEQEACNVIMDLIRKEGREADFSTIESPFHEHFSMSFSSAKRISLFQSAIQLLVSDQELIQEGDTVYLAHSDESEDYDLSAMEYSEDENSHIL